MNRWGDAKAQKSLEKHGVSFEEAWTVFSDPLVQTYSDPDHSVGEIRFLAVGHSGAGILLIAQHRRGDGVLALLAGLLFVPQGLTVPLAGLPDSGWTRPLDLAFVVPAVADTTTTRSPEQPRTIRTTRSIASGVATEVPPNLRTVLIAWPARSGSRRRVWPTPLRRRQRPDP